MRISFQLSEKAEREIRQGKTVTLVFSDIIIKIKKQ